MAKLKVDQALLQAASHVRKGDVEAARALYQTVLAQFPKNARARKGLAKLTRAAQAPATPMIRTGAGTAPGANPPQDQTQALLALYNARDHEALIAQTTALIPQYPNSFTLHSILGAGLRRVNRFEEAAAAFRRAVELNPGSVDSHKNLGMTLINLEQFDEAIEVYRAILAITPEDALAQNNLGLALRDRGQFDAAHAAFDRALAINPGFAEAYNNKGLTHYRQLAFDQALECYAKALARKPDYAAAHYNRGNALKKTEQIEEAKAAFRQALAINPDHADALNNLGTALTEEKSFDEALTVMRRAVALQPQNAVMRNNLGNVWLEQDDYEPAAAAYTQALALDPGYAGALNNMGLALEGQKKYPEAIAAFTKATELRENFSEAFSNMANVFVAMKSFGAAIDAYRKTLEINPDAAGAEASMYYQMRHTCDWSLFDKMEERAPHMGLGEHEMPPFTMLALEDHPARQRSRSEYSARHATLNLTPKVHARPAAPKDRLRIGYFSADYKKHPCLYLIMGILRTHNRDRVEVHAFSYGDDKSGALRAQAVKTVDHFHDVEGLSDQDLLDFAHDKELDIAVDLMGYTQNSRLEVFEGRLAPVQMSYVGYPGTTGAPYIDYLVGDHTVIPAAHRQAYSESILYMPNTYLPNDNQLPISDTPITRADFDLPEDSFVLCCFNNNYKITPHEFDIWMRVLSKVDDAVLWTLATNDDCAANLRKEAAARGVDPDRIITGKKVPHPQHMARHRLADLFADTFIYNAHTTTSEALWAGLPVVTRQGEQFAARVASSMLTSVGLPELITTTSADYEAMLLRLAQDREALQALKSKLAHNRMTQPFFDNAKYTRDLENGFHQAHALYVNGAAPRDIIAGQT